MSRKLKDINLSTDLDGIYLQKTEPFTIGEVGYTRLKDAIDAVLSDQVILVNQDVNLDRTETEPIGQLTKSFAIDLNGKTISISDPTIATSGTDGRDEQTPFLFKVKTETTGSDGNVIISNGTLNIKNMSIIKVEKVNSFIFRNLTINQEQFSKNNDNSSYGRSIEAYASKDWETYTIENCVFNITKGTRPLVAAGYTANVNLNDCVINYDSAVTQNTIQENVVFHTNRYGVIKISNSIVNVTGNKMQSVLGTSNNGGIFEALSSNINLYNDSTMYYVSHEKHNINLKTDMERVILDNVAFNSVGTLTTVKTPIYENIITKNGRVYTTIMKIKDCQFNNTSNYQSIFRLGRVTDTTSTPQNLSIELEGGNYGQHDPLSALIQQKTGDDQVVYLSTYATVIDNR